MRVFFTRHGESEANSLKMISNRNLPHGLTGSGRAQAKCMADRLSGEGISHIFSSTSPRAMETAVIVGNQLGIEPVATASLCEFDCGIYEGRADEPAWNAWQSIFDAWLVHGHLYEKLDGGETYQDVYNRFVPFIQGLVTHYGSTEAEILCISHGGIYRLMLPHIVLNIDPRMFERYGIDYTTCITTEVESGSLRCVEWNADYRPDSGTIKLYGKFIW